MSRLLEDDGRRAELIDPPPASAALPGIGGRIRMRPEDFVVTEIPAYPADAREGAHLLVELEKRERSTDEAVRIVAQRLRIDRREIGVAGRKDRVAVTRQWISVPYRCRDGITAFRDETVRLGAVHAHGHKLRTGHLAGNAFEIVVRQLHVPVAEAIARVHAKLHWLREHGGIDNAFGPQRFGKDGSNLARGLHELAGGRAGRRGNLVVGAAQAGLFNLYLLVRRAGVGLRRILHGDLVKKTITGGMFVCEDVATDDARVRAGELVITGPIFGSRMRSPPAHTDAARLEADVLSRADVSPDALARLGRGALGTRRPLWIAVPDVDVAAAAATGELGEGVRLAFVLPAGAYATRLLGELMSAR